MVLKPPVGITVRGLAGAAAQVRHGGAWAMVLLGERT